MKGQKSRAGGNIKPGFEGGQLPLYRRLPHMRGFHNIFRVSYSVINLDRLAEFKAGSEVDPLAMAEAGLVKSPGELIKVLGNGELKKALKVSAHKFSASARQKLSFVTVSDRVRMAGFKICELGVPFLGKPIRLPSKITGSLS